MEMSPLRQSSVLGSIDSVDSVNHKENRNDITETTHYGSARISNETVDICSEDVDEEQGIDRNVVASRQSRSRDLLNHWGESRVGKALASTEAVLRRLQNDKCKLRFFAIWARHCFHFQDVFGSEKVFERLECLQRITSNLLQRRVQDVCHATKRTVFSVWSDLTYRQRRANIASKLAIAVLCRSIERQIFIRYREALLPIFFCSDEGRSLSEKDPKENRKDFKASGPSTSLKSVVTGNDSKTTGVTTERGRKESATPPLPPHSSSCLHNAITQQENEKGSNAVESSGAPSGSGAFSATGGATEGRTIRRKAPLERFARNYTKRDTSAHHSATKSRAQSLLRASLEQADKQADAGGKSGMLFYRPPGRTSGPFQRPPTSPRKSRKREETSGRKQESKAEPSSEEKVPAREQTTGVTTMVSTDAAIAVESLNAAIAAGGVGTTPKQLDDERNEKPSRKDGIEWPDLSPAEFAESPFDKTISPSYEPFDTEFANSPPKHVELEDHSLQEENESSLEDESLRKQSAEELPSPRFQPTEPSPLIDREQGEKLERPSRDDALSSSPFSAQSSSSSAVPMDSNSSSIPMKESLKVLSTDEQVDQKEVSATSGSSPGLMTSSSSSRGAETATTMKSINSRLGYLISQQKQRDLESLRELPESSKSAYRDTKMSPREISFLSRQSPNLPLKSSLTLKSSPSRQLKSSPSLILKSSPSLPSRSSPNGSCNTRNDDVHQGVERAYRGVSGIATLPLTGVSQRTDSGLTRELNREESYEMPTRRQRLTGGWTVKKNVEFQEQKTMTNEGAVDRSAKKKTILNKTNNGSNLREMTNSKTSPLDDTAKREYTPPVIPRASPVVSSGNNDSLSSGGFSTDVILGDNYVSGSAKSMVSPAFSNTKIGVPTAMTSSSKRTNDVQEPSNCVHRTSSPTEHKWMPYSVGIKGSTWGNNSRIMSTGLTYTMGRPLQQKFMGSNNVKHQTPAPFSVPVRSRTLRDESTMGNTNGNATKLSQENNNNFVMTSTRRRAGEPPPSTSVLGKTFNTGIQSRMSRTGSVSLLDSRRSSVMSNAPHET